MFREITIQFTEQCNVACPYCFAPIKSKNRLSEVDFNTFKEFCLREKPDVIHVTGGEPMLNPDFAYFITELSKISSLVIYSNFTIPNVIEGIIADVSSDIVFLVNITSKMFCNETEKENMRDNIQTALKKGFRVALSYTFYDSNMSLKKQFDYLLSKMKEYKLRNLRLSQALDFSEDQRFLSKKDIQELYHYVATHISEWKNENLSVYFDCPVPPCYLNPIDFTTLRDNSAATLKCITKVFVMWNLDVTHCYSTMDVQPKKKLTDFQNLQQAKEYSTNILRKIQNQSNRAGCYKCKYGEDNIPCGCPSYCV